ncbi:MAG TPA: hypothetical protein VGB94_02845 [Acidobacteriaceae bacterium]
MRRLLHCSGFALLLFFAPGMPTLHSQTSVLPAQESVTAATASASCCGIITPEGRRMLALLDSMDVEHHWLNHEHVDWVTGNQDRPDGYTGSDKSSHCSAFAAAVGLKLNVYILRPPEHKLTFLASAQGEWLASKTAIDAGWSNIPDPARAQHLANLGAFVVVDYVSPDPHTPGHIAIIRPSEKTAAQLAHDGPEITQSGATNYKDYVAAKAFMHHPGAWPNEVRYYSHPVQWSGIVPAASTTH